MIHTTDLIYRYANGAELRFPDVDIPQGGVMLLKGPSGSGKSTWLALAAGLLRASSGQIVVAGQDLNALKKIATDAWRAGTIGFLPQKLHLSEALTVAGNLAMAQWAAGVPNQPQQVMAVLASLGLSDLAQRLPCQLSGGQAQRVALARAVLLAPKVILADEPTASLDDEAATAALALLQASAARAGATLVIATHDSRVAQALPNAFECRLSEFLASKVPQVLVEYQ